MKTGVTILPPAPTRRKCAVCGTLTDRLETYEEGGIEISVPVHEECSGELRGWYLKDVMNHALRLVKNAAMMSRSNHSLIDSVRELSEKIYKPEGKR